MNRKVFYRLVRTKPLGVIAACIFMAAFVQLTNASQLKEPSNEGAGNTASASSRSSRKVRGRANCCGGNGYRHSSGSSRGHATLQLPGQLSAYTDAPIYAQTSGYLKSWSFDIGAKVKANDILGEIDTPEVDQALAQAKAQFETDTSALQLAQVTYKRYQLLFEQKVLDAQTRDTAADTYYEDQAKVAADKANIERLNALEAFKLLRAPFDGIVTARDVDVGAYVANGSGNQLFRVARTSPLRIYVNVPQRDAQLVRIRDGGRSDSAPVSQPDLSSARD